MEVAVDGVFFGKFGATTVITKVQFCRGLFAVHPQENDSNVSSAATAKFFGLWSTTATRV